MLKVVSIIHPSVQPTITEGLAAASFAAGAFDACRILPSGGVDSRHTRTLPVRGGVGLLGYYRELRRVVRELRPDVLHVQADPSSALALQAAAISARPDPSPAMVVECDYATASAPLWPFSAMRRRVLGKAGAAIARHSFGLQHLAAAGFDGASFIIGPQTGLSVASGRSAPHDRGTSRAALDLPATGSLIVGFVGDLVEGHGILDVLEGVAACRSAVVLIVQGAGPLRREIIDRAASLGASERIRVLATDPATAASIFDALDALIVLPRPRFASRPGVDRSIAAAHAGGVPVIVSDVPGLSEMIGAGGWRMAPGDPGLLAGLLHRLASTPDEVAQAAAAARAEWAFRYADAALQDGLRRAFDAAHIAGRAGAPHTSGRRRATSQLRGSGL